MPAYKLRNFNPVRSVNGEKPDKSGNVMVSTTGTNFKEEIFLAEDNSLTLAYSPLVQVPLTVTINGLVQTDYLLTGKTLVFPEGSVEVNDIVRIMYAHGG